MRIHGILRRLVWNPAGILSILRPILGRQILDLGCGFGHFSYLLAMKMSSAQILGIDRSARKIEKAKKAYRLPNLEFETRDARDFQTGHKWDAVFACDLFHHLPKNDYEKVLNNIREQLRDTGVLVIKDINGESRLRYWNTVHDLIINRNMPTYCSTKKWEKLLQGQGLHVERKIVSTQYFYRHIYILCRTGSRQNKPRQEPDHYVLLARENTL